MTASYTLHSDASLASRNTLRVPARAAWLAELTDATGLPGLLARPEAQNRVLALGGGSNILFTGDFDGLVVWLATRGITELESGRVRVAAGENWDTFVRWSLAHGYAGLENLILIPGSVGAAPIQNIGAYGVEVREFVYSVSAWDREQRTMIELDNGACAFAYRDSVFKREPQRFIVTEVEFALPRTREPVLDYAGVRDELDAMGVADPDHTQIGAAVERLRRRKLPDPAVIGNAGSFFKNPVIPAAQAVYFRQEYPTAPVYPLGGGMAKLSAAWLLDYCGFKGVREGDAGFSERHALVLVNHGAATGAQLWALASHAREKVAHHFGLTLEPEPVVIGSA